MAYLGLHNLLSAISHYKFHILNDYQENIKDTIICHLITFYQGLHINK